MTQHLYRHFDEDNRLLYVGISTNPFRRLRQHLSKSHWSYSIDMMTIERFDTRKEVKEAERIAIRRERPLHNILMNGKKRRRSRSKRGGWKWFRFVLIAVLAGVAHYNYPALLELFNSVLIPKLSALKVL